jgi:hypothetical protein
MDRRVILSSILALGATPVRADQLDQLLGGAAKLTNGASAGGLPLGVSQADAQGGLKEALSRGAVAAVMHVGRLDGFWGDGHIRIPLPKPLNNIQKSLAPMGMSGPLDDVHMKINRAAETAAPKAQRLFTDAVRGMTVEDVVGVLRGGDTAGTQYLKSRTGDHLGTLFHPPMKQALNSTGAVRSFSRVVESNGVSGLFGGSDPVDSLVKFAVAKALDGVFYYVGEEERAIRRDPIKQSSNLLRKVFGGL